jgi:hypothetical protein
MPKTAVNLLPEPHMEHVERVCALIAETPTSLRDRLSSLEGLSASYALRLVEDPSIICISGARGSGKTTVLATAAARLATEGHVVIPPIRPEYFPALGSLLPSAVAQLQTTMATDWDNDNALDEGASLKVEAALDRTLRQANLISIEGSDASPLRADEQAADRSLAASADSTFIDSWQRLTTEVRQTAAIRRGRSDYPLIVLPVDDPDLAPGALPQILLDLRLLTSVDGVVGITCLDLDEARAVLFDAYSRSYHTPPSRLLAARVVEAQIAKAFPDDRRVTISGLTDEQRLSFVPLDLTLPSIEKLCKKYTLSESGQRDNIATVLRLPVSGRPSAYADALPANPRDLRGLAYRLYTIPESSHATGHAAMELCRAVVANGLRQSGAIDADLWPAGLPFEERTPVDGRPSCIVRFDNIRFTGLSHARVRLPGGKRDDGTTIVAAGHDSEIASELAISDDAKGSMRLDPSFTAAMLLVREYAEYYDAFECAVSGSVPARGGSRPSTYLEVILDGERTDDQFLNAPAWESYYDYFALDEGVDLLLSVAQESHSLRDRRIAFEAYFLDFCRNVVAVQLKRKPARDPSRVSAAVREVNGRAPEEIIETELARLFGEIERCHRTEVRKPTRAIRKADFELWNEVLLARICHTRLVRPEFITEFLRRRTRMLEARNRLGVANGELIDLLEARIRRALDEKWVVSLIELLEKLDKRRGDILFASHAAAMEALERGRNRLLGESVLSRSEQPPKGERDEESEFEIAMATLDRLEAEVTARMRQRQF